MIIDSRENPASLPLCAQVYRPADGAWYERETHSWRTYGSMPKMGFPYTPVPGLDGEYSLAILTPPEIWGLNIEIIVYVIAYMDEEWCVVDRFAATVNPSDRGRSQVLREILMHER
jgi:hypothetical protein